jgi:hypothetical protein
MLRFFDLNKGLFVFWGTFICSVITYGQSIEPNSKISMQGQVEIVMSHDLSNRLELNHKFTDSIFAIAQNTTLELEKNLLYKMSDKVHLILFDQLGEYQNYQRNHFTGNFVNTFSEKEAFGIYFPVFLLGNISDIKIQLRYGIAKQFIDEYLFGLSLREKSDNAYSQRVPDWMVYGFVNYFANSIQVIDFQKFEIYNNLGKFSNINNIPKAEQHIFGTVLWYLFEKEKGKNFNSAFWNLIRSANSFENSFGYYFGISFKNWLKERTKEIENFKSKRTLNYDYRITRSKKSDGIITMLLSENLSSSQMIRIEYPLHEKILLKKDDNYKTIAENNFLGLYPSIQLNQTSFYNDNKIKALLYFSNDEWHFKSLKTINNLGKFGIFRSLKLLNDSFYAIFEDIGKSYLVNLSKITVPVLLNAHDQNKIEDYLINSDLSMVLSTVEYSNRFNKFKSQVLFIRNGVTKTIYSDDDVYFPVSIKNFIQESHNRISFIRSSESNQKLIYIENKNNTWNVKALDTKGLFYSQTISNNKKSIFEIYYNNKYFYVNELGLGEDFVLSDTFKPKSYSFDTLKKVAIENKPKLMDSSYGYFLSNFKISPNRKRTHYSKIENIKPPILSNYENWFYATNVNFQLSNEEMNLPYSIDVPIKSLFNSFYTLYLNGKLASSNNKHKIDFTAFTNPNRRRIGLSFLHAYLLNSTLTSSTEFNYRLREYITENNLSSNRNRTFLIHHNITKKYPFFSLSTGGSYQFQQIIYLNNNPGLSEFQNKNQHFVGFQFCANIDSKQILNRNSNFHFQTIAIYVPQITLNINEIKNSSYLKLNGLVAYEATYFKLRSALNAKYAIGESYILNFIGGSKGWINENQYNGNQIQLINRNDFFQIQSAGFIRGFYAGDRIGSSSICSQTELTICPIQILPMGLVESRFFKTLTLVAFCDIGTAFIGKTPKEATNFFNTYIFSNPNYQISITAARNPYLIGLGYGLNVEIFGYDVRFEYGYGYKENTWQKPILHVGFGKNF